MAFKAGCQGSILVFTSASFNSAMVMTVGPQRKHIGSLSMALAPGLANHAGHIWQG